MEAWRTLAFDIECFANYFLIAFRNVGTGKVVAFEQYEGHPLDVARVRRILQSFRLVTFNGTHYDIPVLSMALSGADCAQIRAVSDAIIVDGLRYWEVAKRFNFPLVEVNHVDLIEVAPGAGSLKLYGGRLHCRSLQDLPLDPTAIVSPAQHDILRTYCGNDLELTVALGNELAPQSALRESMSTEYGIDLRSKSDAQLAEAVLRQSVQKLSGRKLVRPEVKPGTQFQFDAPSFVHFATPRLQDVLERVEEAEFIVDTAGVVQMPEALSKLTVAIGGSIYRMGMGGLHSTEVTVAHVSDADTALVDFDVASFYPSIILICGFTPKHMGAHFLSVYRSLVERRLAAKRGGDKVVADALKICVNGIFGKLGSKWSVLFSPDLLIQVTMTGQLVLLMLIELLEMNSIAVVSANTDGIVVKCPRSKMDELNLIVEHWEYTTGFETEATPYEALYQRDVNSYIAIKSAGGAKTKGAFALDAGLSKNPANEICVEAAIAYLTDGLPIASTIRTCPNVRKFVSIRTVRGGAVKGDVYLGKVVRWYYAIGEAGAIHYKTTGNKVARTAGAKPLMTIPEVLPTDIDFDWYIAEARAILADIGVNVALTATTLDATKSMGRCPHDLQSARLSDGDHAVHSVEQALRRVCGNGRRQDGVDAERTAGA